jgi:hypothetical protein
VLTAEQTGPLLAAVALSMALTPLLMILNEKLILPRFGTREQAEREALQMAAHCDALPEEMLPGMVAVQRLRDAVLARAVIRALDETDGPVAVITGSGHARRDWGVPAALAEVAPDLDVWVLGQTEDGRPLEGGFDTVKSAPAVERPDPCVAFQ